MDLCQQIDGLANSRTDSQPDFFSSPLHTSKHVIFLVRHQNQNLPGPGHTTIRAYNQHPPRAETNHPLHSHLQIIHSGRTRYGIGGNEHGANWRSEFTHTAFLGGLGLLPCCLLSSLSELFNCAIPPTLPSPKYRRHRVTRCMMPVKRRPK